MQHASADLHIVHPDDDVGIALRALAAGEAVAGITVRAAVPKGHKIAVKRVVAGGAAEHSELPVVVGAQPRVKGAAGHSHKIAG
jgi:altronate hydrolase